MEIHNSYLTDRCNQPMSLLSWRKNVGVLLIITSRSYGDKGKAIICYSHKCGGSEGVRDPVKVVAKTHTESLITMSLEKLLFCMQKTGLFSADFHQWLDEALTKCIGMVPKAD